MTIKGMWSLQKPFAMLLVFCMVLSFAGCQNQRAGNSSHSGDLNSSTNAVPPTSAEQALLDEYVIVFSETFSWEFIDTSELYEYVGNFSLWQLYEEHPRQEDGTHFVSKSRLEDYVAVHFGISDYEYTEELPKYNEEADGYFFYPVGEGSNYIAEIMRTDIVGNEANYYVKLTPKPAGEERDTGEQPVTICYKFLLVSNDGEYELQAVQAAIEE